jgi:ABC-type Na+ efflux pump permease subunit
MPAATLARFVVLEAWRSGLAWLALVCIVLAAALSGFLSQVAIAESRALQLAIIAATLRACAVFLVAVHVASSTLREINDKGLELMLSLPLGRSTHYLGRLAGFAACGALVAVAFCAPLAFWAPADVLALWGVSLACECVVVAAAALFFAMSLGQLVPAIGASVGLYLLARSMAAIQAIAAGPHADASIASDAARALAAALAFLLPPLDTVTRTEWLVYGVPSTGAAAAAIAGLAVYALLLTAAGLFDFHRKSL